MSMASYMGASGTIGLLHEIYDKIDKPHSLRNITNIVVHTGLTTLVGYGTGLIYSISFPYLIIK